MANEESRLKAEPRTEQGSVAAGRVRRAGFLPAAVNRIEGGTTLVKFSTHDFVGMLRHHTSEHVLVTIELEGKDVPALMREVQYDVITGTPIHADFGEISLTKKIHLTIPVFLHGEPEGVKVEGGVLQQVLREVEVACLPGDIVEHFDVDVSEMKKGQSLFVRDLALGEKFTILSAKDQVVATVAAPEGEGDAAEEATPEVITKGKKDAKDAKGAKK